MIMSKTKAAKAFLAAAFVTAASLGALAPAVTIPALSAAAVPAAMAVRVGSVVEISASLLAGLAAAFLTNRRGIKA